MPSVWRRRPADRLQVGVLVAAALVLGLVLGAASLIGVWQASARRGDRATEARTLADARLAAMRTRSATLSRRLHSVEAKLVAVSRQRHQLELALSNSLAKSNRSAQLASSEQRTLIAFRHRAAAVNSDLVSLEAYVRSTPAQALDSGFLQSQLAYLAKAALGLQRP